jgi:hypothetical protein
MIPGLKGGHTPVIAVSIRQGYFGMPVRVEGSIINGIDCGTVFEAYHQRLTGMDGKVDVYCLRVRVQCTTQDEKEKEYSIHFVV